MTNMDNYEDKSYLETIAREIRLDDIIDQDLYPAIRKK